MNGKKSWRPMRYLANVVLFSVFDQSIRFVLYTVILNSKANMSFKNGFTERSRCDCFQLPHAPVRYLRLPQTAIRHRS